MTNSAATSTTSSWLQEVDFKFATNLQGRLRHIERFVSDSLEWLKGVRQEALTPMFPTETSQLVAPSRKRKRGRPRKGTLAPTITAACLEEDKSEVAKAEQVSTPVKAMPAIPIIPTTVTKDVAVVDDGVNTSVMATAMKKRRGRPRKTNVPMTPINVIDVAPTLLLSIAKELITDRQAAVGVVTPRIITEKQSRPQQLHKTPGQELSSMASPMKTPLPINYTSNALLSPAKLSVVGKTQVTGKVSTLNEPMPKIEAWTSKFVTRGSGVLATATTATREKARDLPFVEVPPIVDETRGINPKTLMAPALRTSTINTTASVSASRALDVSAVEFVPPPPSTVTRRQQRREIPVEYVESPLTRARRVDAQSTWREAQLKNYLAAKVDLAKSALGSLRAENNSSAEVINADAPSAILAKPPVSDETKAIVAGASSSKPMDIVIESDAKMSTTTAMAACESECLFIAAEQPPSASVVTDDFIFDFDPPATTTTEAISISNKEEQLSIPETDRLSGEKSYPTLDPLELERRRRLKERNEKAVEKKKQLLQKAQQIRSRTVANLSGKPKDLPPRKGTSTTVKAIAPPPLQRQAVLNSMLSKTEASTPPRGGVFKMPLPKVKTPGSIKSSGDHPSSDDTFTIATSNNNGKYKKEKDALQSPKLPQIPTDSSEEEDELAASKNIGPAPKENRPIWANTPEVSKSLLQQRSIRPEDIFGEVEPVKLEDFFKGSGKKYSRGRTSSVWHS